MKSRDTKYEKRPGLAEIFKGGKKEFVKKPVSKDYEREMAGLIDSAISEYEQKFESNVTPTGNPVFPYARVGNLEDWKSLPEELVEGVFALEEIKGREIKKYQRSSDALQSADREFVAGLAVGAFCGLATVIGVSIGMGDSVSEAASAVIAGGSAVAATAGVGGFAYAFKSLLDYGKAMLDVNRRVDTIETIEEGQREIREKVDDYNMVNLGGRFRREVSERKLQKEYAKAQARRAKFERDMAELDAGFEKDHE